MNLSQLYCVLCNAVQRGRSRACSMFARSEEDLSTLELDEGLSMNPRQL